ncbi:protein kinase regulatory subunit ATG17 Ecym_7020 [Eremothecium cymbalariae DBVPG|uniref:Autophagy-related protein 17 n=1 Tax=Eremothecium cymbalariae (strain CBS 270.75 / DBVPG 7215 / KCTC 17166 / NRRL Y-17582) TaxID=931890 RepID=G8JVL2_ERECY|nr:hypothetical protein Ecym_7020 [Eremothecium cymbalariae DBVPG\
MIEQNEIHVFWENAQKYLSKAQVLCQKSQATLTSSQSRVTELQRTVSKIQFTLGCIHNQATYLANDILTKTIGNQLIQREWKKVVLDDMLKEMQHCQEKMVLKVEALSNMENTLSHDGRNLADFISMDNMHILNEKLKDLPVVKSQVSNIIAQYESLVEKVTNQLLKARVRKLEEEFNDFFVSDRGKYVLLDNYLHDIHHLEEDLVDILKSLTAHFDKCTLLKTKKLPTKEQEELFKIVKNDNAELESIMGMLIDIIVDINELAENITLKIRQKDKEKQLIKNSMVKILGDFTKYEEYLSVFQGVNESIANFKNSCIQDIKKVQELCDFYDNFLNSYQQLLREVDRRRKLAERMKSILQSCENQLAELNNSDLKKRQLFLLEHGDYLPENIWPNNIDDLAPLYTLDYNIKKI